MGLVLSPDSRSFICQQLSIRSGGTTLAHPGQ